jgi:hypothetical protein
MKRLVIKNWSTFQHYKYRNPPWIKLHRSLLDEPDWYELSGDEAKFLIEVWLIASSEDGYLPETKKIAFRTRRTESEVQALLDKLQAFIKHDASMMQDRVEKRRDREEKSKEEKREERNGHSPDTIAF